MPSNVSLCSVLILSFAASIGARNAAAQNDAVPGLATTVQLPTFGVAVDAEGFLRLKTSLDPKLLATRRAAARRTLPADVARPSKLRKVSLRRLEAAIQDRLATGADPTPTMRYLAGLQRVQFVFFFPDDGDIVIAGPAEGWVEDPTGRVIGLRSGRPVVLLEDLAVALRAYPPRGRAAKFVGCTIDPSEEGLAKLRAFQQTIPSVIPQRQRQAAAQQIARGVRQSLGTAGIRVFGISEQTNFAKILVEADYRMKRIAIGLEPPPVRMTTFISALRVPKHLTLQRWWFTPDYDGVKVEPSGLAMEMVGQGVQLQSEDKLIGSDGSLTAAPAARPSKAAQLYTTAFTKKYPQIADATPVYAQLRNLIDLLIAAAFMQREDYAARADWDMATYLDEAQLPVETLAGPRRVDCAVNVFWRGQRLLCPAGGGVSIEAHEALSADRIETDANGQLAKRYTAVEDELPEDTWWWD